RVLPPAAVRSYEYNPSLFPLLRNSHKRILKVQVPLTDSLLAGELLQIFRLPFSSLPSSQYTSLLPLMPLAYSDTSLTSDLIVLRHPLFGRHSGRRLRGIDSPLGILDQPP